MRIENLYGLLDILFANRVERSRWHRPSAAAAGQLAQRTRCWVVKAGPTVRASFRTNTGGVPGLSVKAVDPTGAGDAFNADSCSGISQAAQRSCLAWGMLRRMTVMQWAGAAPSQPSDVAEFLRAQEKAPANTRRPISDDRQDLSQPSVVSVQRKGLAVMRGSLTLRNFRTTCAWSRRSRALRRTPRGWIALRGEAAGRGDLHGVRIVILSLDDAASAFQQIAGVRAKAVPARRFSSSRIACLLGRLVDADRRVAVRDDHETLRAMKAVLAGESRRSVSRARRTARWRARRISRSARRGGERSV